MTTTAPLATLALVGILAGVAPAVAQGAPDYAGVWVLEREQGDLPARAAKAIDGEGPTRREVIVQDGDRLEIRHGDAVFTLMLDGSEHSYDSAAGPVTARTRRDGTAIVTEGTRPFPTPFGRRTVRYTERRTLLDGGRMQVELVLDTPRGAKTRRVVFRRQPD